MVVTTVLLGLTGC